MKVLALPGDEEFDSLPPALRRKYFSSNAESLRTLAHHSHGPLPRSRLADVPGRLHFTPLRSQSSSVNSPSRRRRLDKPRRKSHKLCKPRSLRLAHLAAQADSQCFFSLPAKIQQSHFSEEERFLIRQAHHQNIAFGVANQSLGHLQNAPQTSWSLSSHPSQSTFQASTLYFDPSDSSDSDNSDGDPNGNMDDSMYDSFRWLDDDAELDLTLDGYQGNNAPSTAKPPRRRPSFRRTMTFNTVQFGRKAPLAITHKRIPSLSRLSQGPSPLTKTTSHTSISRPSSRQQSPHYIPRSSISSIDPSAQYYQDPEARLKLRVFLASPQKFDEAIEFGFPALEKENHSPNRSLVEEEQNPVEFTGTFLEDDDASLDGDKDDKDQPSPSRFSKDMEGSSPTSAALCKGQWRPWTPHSGPPQISENREMTLKMTLTRPDLRTESSTPSSVGNPGKDASIDTSPRVLEADLDDQGTMKKMWRRLWKQKS